MKEPPLAVVVVTYNSASHVAATLAAVQTQLAEGDELIVIDNASSDDSEQIARAAGARVVALGENVGFGAGCHAGVEASTAPLVLFLNPDAELAAGCLGVLRDAAGRHPDWGAWQALVTLPDGERVNTSGGVIHFLGLAWAGGCEAPVATATAEDRPVSFASGAALVVRREAWDAVGGFDPEYFMYGEDVDLSLRMRLAGWEVGIVPGARVGHDYDFDKGPQKWYWLERNRWRTVLADYPPTLLVALAPALLLLELALLPVAAAGGWLGPKLRAQVAVARSLPALLARRRAVQRTRRVSARAFAGHLTASLDSPYLGGAARVRVLVSLQSVYWRAVVALLGGRR